MNEIAKAYSTDNWTPETDEEDVVISKVKHSEAMKALQKLCLFGSSLYHISIDTKG